MSLACEPDVELRRLLVVWTQCRLLVIADLAGLERLFLLLIWATTHLISYLNLAYLLLALLSRGKLFRIGSNFFLARY